VLQRHRVLLCVKGVDVPSESGSTNGGFYVTVVASASDAESAVSSAIRALTASAKYQRVVGARSPSIVPEAVEEATVDQPEGVLTGYVFFPDKPGGSLA
jgi:hypothetical protein